MGKDKKIKAYEKQQQKAAEEKEMERKQTILNAAETEQNALSLLNVKSFKMKPDRLLNVQSCSGDKLSKELQKSCFKLFEANMKEQYKASSSGYNAAATKRDMFHKDSRYLVVTENIPDSDNDALAFVHYRLFLEEDMKLTMCVYEIQVCEDLQRSGVGKRLMILLEILCRKFEFQQLLVTVFDVNVKALNFYKKLGYGLHESSPLPEEKIDFQVLCKVFEEPAKAPKSCGGCNC